MAHPFIDEGTDLNYGTAFAPVPDDEADTYGIGRVGGTIVGIPRGSAHEAEAWLLVKFMATNTDSLVAAANDRQQCRPPTSPSSRPICRCRRSSTRSSTCSRTRLPYKDDGDRVRGPGHPVELAAKWQSGRVTDLEAGLAQVAQQIDDQLEQASG